MITVSGTRRRGDEFFTNCPVRHTKSIEDALVAFLKFEIGYGGHVTAVHQHKGDTWEIVTETPALACVDTTSFSGSRADMEALLVAALYVVRFQTEYREILTEAVVKTLDLRGKGALALAVVHGSPLIMGQITVRGATMLACGVTNPETIAKARIEDVVAAWKLAQESGQPIESLLS